MVLDSNNFLIQHLHGCDIGLRILLSSDNVLPSDARALPGVEGLTSLTVWAVEAVTEVEIPPRGSMSPLEIPAARVNRPCAGRARKSSRLKWKHMEEALNNARAARDSRAE